MRQTILRIEVILRRKASFSFREISFKIMRKYRPMIRKEFSIQNFMIKFLQAAPLSH